MHNANLKQWLSWLESLYIERSALQALDDFKTVANRLGLLPFNKKVITITGTNGKGSCVAILESIYLAAGYQVGSYTSPHLFQFNERIRLQGQSVHDQSICLMFEKIDQIRKDTPLTYFQFATLAALLIFQQESLDLVILEIGIGGKYDVVNVIEPTLSMISSIDLDHCHMLGNTRELIGIEKAGVMRPNKPTVCGDLDPPDTLFQEANRIDATLYCIKKDFFYVEHDDDSWCWQYQDIKLTLPKPSLLLCNAATALMGMALLQSQLPVSTSAICKGLKTVSLQGRGQVEQIDGVQVLFDVAHNPAAAKYLYAKYRSLEGEGSTYAVVGMLKNKDVLQTLEPFINKVASWFVTSLPEPRGLSAKQIAKTLETLESRNIQCYDTPLLAYKQALQHAKPGDLILVFGSFMVVGMVLNRDKLRG